MDTLKLFTDGSSARNPGPSGYGYIIEHNGQTEQGSRSFRLSTNNRMEMLALADALKLIQEKIARGEWQVSEIEAFTDSEYLCKCITARWYQSWRNNNWIKKDQTPVKNKDMWEQIISEIERLPSMNIRFTITHIYGHSGHPQNEACDQLAKTAANNVQAYEVDTVYENENPGGGNKRPQNNNQGYQRRY